ncbi:(2Fe-2S)-binding protein [Symmachiella dynata]|uniref:BFD-like [2Fe-2S] binding domain protein n=1 Tax=Symmachiella dynata TaxID=2527995 RepID=A0A517ZRM8_9PLAN|nr:(2Fe-2S)-binding protein [Symmachiella dynata]QDU45141.1 BFD-like [2Fe-2S] binding domain protein [Symmachiella dynata]
MSPALELDDTICYCFHVSKRKIVNYIRIHNLKRPSQVSQCGGAGTGCGWCVSYLKRYFEAAAATNEPGNESQTAEEYAEQRAAYIAAGNGTPPAGAIPLPGTSAPDADSIA